MLSIIIITLPPISHTLIAYSCLAGWVDLIAYSYLAGWVDLIAYSYLAGWVDLETLAPTCSRWSFML